MHSTTPNGSSAPPLLQPSPARLTELSHAACEYVARATSLDLDHSEESLAYVDHYLRLVRDGTQLKPEVADLVAAAMGVYLGETMIARFGGRWLAIPMEPSHTEQADTPLLDSIDDPMGWRVELEAAPLVCDPLSWARQALRSDHEEEDDADDSGGLVAPSSVMEPLQAALARLPPVSEEYFYSLTGRFETVSYLVEILASLRAAEEDAESDSDNAANPQ